MIQTKFWKLTVFIVGFPEQHLRMNTDTNSMRLNSEKSLGVNLFSGNAATEGAIAGKCDRSLSPLFVNLNMPHT